MADVKLLSFSVRNYRTIEQAELDFESGAVGLVGVNASGKTNVARALICLCDVVRDKLPHLAPQAQRVAVTEGFFGPLENLQPSGLLFDPSPGQKTEMGVTARIPSYLIPERGGPITGHIDTSSATHELELGVTLTSVHQAGGEPKLVPSFTIAIDGLLLTNEDIGPLLLLWKQFGASRLQALRPASESLQALLQLTKRDVRGHTSFEQMTDKVRQLDPNFARVSFIGDRPMAVEGGIPDLTIENMSSGNLSAIEICSPPVNPEYTNAIAIFVEEPESHFHPALQRKVVRQLINGCREKGRTLCIETHSPHVLAELYAQGVPVYRVAVISRDESTRMRRSRVSLLPKGEAAGQFLAEMGVEAGFAVLGGVVVVTDGPTDPPVYRHFFSLFPELENVLLCFVPMGCLEARGLELGELRKLAERVIVLADGHFQSERGDRLRGKCKDANVEYLQLDHWGVENFFTLDCLKEAAKGISGLKVGEEATLEPMQKLDGNPGVCGFSKDHLGRIARHVKREELESQPDFVLVVEYLLKTLA